MPRVYHGWLSVVDINSRLCCAAALGDHEATGRVDVNITHPVMIDPLTLLRLVQKLVCEYPTNIAFHLMAAASDKILFWDSRGFFLAI